MTWLTTDPQIVYDRRNLVLKDMMGQGYLTPSEYETDINVTLPNPQYVETPSEENTQPGTGYFANWIRQQLLANPKFNKLVYGGGLRVHTTLDSQLQSDAENAVTHYLPANSGGPSAALVAIDSSGKSNGFVRAMVGGYDYNTHAFNLATQAERQPGSAFKAFDLAAALEAGYNRNTRVLSAPCTLQRPRALLHLHRPQRRARLLRRKDPALAGAGRVRQQRLRTAQPHLQREWGRSRSQGSPRSFGITTGISINPSMVIGGSRKA